MPKKPLGPQLSREVFARNLRRARRLKELSQEALAFEAEMSRAYLSRVEQGTMNISMDKADALAKALGLPLHDLINPEKFQNFDMD